MRSLSQLFLLLLILAPLATAEWVRFEAEDAILSSVNAEIREYSGTSGGEAVFLLNGEPAGTIDFVVNVREPNLAGVPMRVGFCQDGNNDQKLDDFFVNDMAADKRVGAANYACGYYADVINAVNGDKVAYADFFNSITTYGSPELFQVISRWWEWWGPKQNVPMTVPLVNGKNTIRIKSGWSHTAYDYIELDLPKMAYDPDPADGDTEVRSTQTTLSWDNPAGTTKNIIYFGQSDTEPNISNYQSLLTTVITLNNPGANPSIAMPTLPLVDGKNYYWLVDGYIGSETEPSFPGPIWSFKTQFNAAPVVTIEDQYAYLGQGSVPGQVVVALDAAINEPVVSYAWTKVSGPAGDTINSLTTEDTTVTITAANIDTNPYYQYQLTVSDGVRTGTGFVKVYVGTSACDASLKKAGQRNIADIDWNCSVSMSDFSIMASKWLNCIDTVTGNNCN